MIVGKFVLTSVFACYKARFKLGNDMLVTAGRHQAG